MRVHVAACRVTVLTPCLSEGQSALHSTPGLEPGVTCLGLVFFPLQTQTTGPWPRENTALREGRRMGLTDPYRVPSGCWQRNLEALIPSIWITPGFKALSSRRPVGKTKTFRVCLHPGGPRTPPSPLSRLTFWAAVCGAYHCAILPDRQVGFSVLVVICVEVPLPDLTPKLEEGAGVRDRVCLADPQEEDSQQRDRQSQDPNSRFHPVHQ